MESFFQWVLHAAMFLAPLMLMLASLLLIVFCSLVAVFGFKEVRRAWGRWKRIRREGRHEP